METSKRSLFAPLILQLLFLLFSTSHAQFKGQRCSPSSCGDIVNITSPFRLKTDPKRCGDPRYELSCENNFTVLYFDKIRYYVQAINYNNYTIRVVDSDFRKDNCSSVPRYPSDRVSKPMSLWKYIGPESVFESISTAKTIVFLNCETQVNSPLYVEIAHCNYLSQTYPNKYHYVVDGGLMVYEIENSCRVELKAFVSGNVTMNSTTFNYVDVRKLLNLGFELSWAPNHCHNYYFNMNPCGVTEAKWILFLSARLSINFGVLAIAHAVLKLVMGTPVVVALLIYKWRRRHLSTYNCIEEFLQRQNNLMPIRYSYSDLKKMTKNFKNKLGEGGYGSVFKGKLRSGRFVAIKMLNKSKGNGQDFINEVATIGTIHHVNVVRLIGFCVERSKHALVYDFMPNGSLDSHIFSKAGNQNSFLSNKKLFEISLGVARGLEYLHRGCCMQILHFDIKPHNILLDENFTPKVSDFGLARLCPADNSIVALTAARGTLGYIAPELFYKNIGGVSYKADVYSFGMLLMEMASKRKNLNAVAENSSQIYYPSWVYEQFSKGESIHVDDLCEEDSETMKKMIIVALWCIQLKPSDRPSMSGVIEMLEGDVQCLEMPPKPSYYPQETVVIQDTSDSTTISSVLSENAEM